MADNTTLNLGSGGDIIRTEDRSGTKTSVSLIDVGGVSAEALIGDGTNSMPTNPQNVVSTNNSTTATLGISGNYTGTADDVLKYSSISIVVYSDQSSSTDGMKFQFSSDNSNWDDTYNFTFTATETRRFQFPVTARYFRINYTNGGVGQTAFRVQTILHTHPINTSVHRLEDVVSPDRSAEVVKSALIAQINGTGNFTPVAATAQGALETDITDIGGTAVTTNTGNAGNGTQRVVLADNQPSVSIDDGGTPLNVSAATVTVSGTVTANAGTGTLSVDLGSNNDVQGATAEGVAVAGNPFLIAGDDGTNVKHVAVAADGAIHIDDGGNTITVDGTVTANAGTGTFTVDLGANNDIQGDIAHDSPDSGNPIKIGAVVKTGLSGLTLPIADDRTDLHADEEGALVTRSGFHFDDFLHNSISNTNGNSTDFTGDFAAPGASVSNYVTSICIANTSATDGTVDFRDGSAGAVLWTVPIPANGGATLSAGGMPLFKCTANTALAYDVSAALSTVYISVSGFKSKVG